MNKKEIIDKYNIWKETYKPTNFNCNLRCCFVYYLNPGICLIPCKKLWKNLYKDIGKNLDINEVPPCSMSNGSNEIYSKIQKDFIKYLKNNRLEIE